jgi:hypothetical protein
MRYLLSILAVSCSVHAADNCVRSFDLRNPVVAKIDKMAGGSLTTGEWLVCGGNAVRAESACPDPKQITRLEFELRKGQLFLTIKQLAQADLDKYALKMAKDSLLSENELKDPEMMKKFRDLIQSFTAAPLEVRLCAQSGNAASVKIVGLQKELLLQPGRDGTMQITELEPNTGANK